jgi:hypothetical protein
MMHPWPNEDDGAADARTEQKVRLVAELDQAFRYGDGRAARELLALMTEVRDQTSCLWAKAGRIWTDVCSNIAAATRKAKTDPPTVP